MAMIRAGPWLAKGSGSGKSPRAPSPGVAFKSVGWCASVTVLTVVPGDANVRTARGYTAWFGGAPRYGRSCGSGLTLGAGVGGGVHLAHGLNGDMRINLGGRHRRMPQEFLYNAHIRTTRE